MGRRIGLALLLVLMGMSARAQTPHDEGLQAGRSAQPVLRGFLQPGSAVATLPPGHYNANPPQAAYYGTANLSASTSAQIAYCSSAAAINDVTCEAIRTARSSAATPRPPVLPTDREVTTAKTVLANPSASGVALSGTYSACTTQTNTITAPLHDLQSCNNYYLRSVDNQCQKTLSVDVTWQCPPGTIKGPFRTIDGSGKATWMCTVQTTRNVYSCPAGWLGPAFMAIPPTFHLDMGCADPVTDQRIAASVTTITQNVDTAAAATETERWDNPCAGYEARVPPGALLADGVDASSATGTLGNVSTVDKCYRTLSTCSDPGTTPRMINDFPVTRACWQWSNAFDCVTADARSDCHQPRFGQCAALGAPTCVEWDAVTQPPFCSHARHDFRCRTADAVTQTVQNCGTQTFCEGGRCWDTSHPPDADFARSVAYLEAQREAGRYFDANQLQVFKGFHNTCSKKMFGLVNCCNRGGTNANSSFTNQSLAGNRASSGGKTQHSSYTYDALFAADSPDLVSSGFGGWLGKRSGASLKGFAGNLTVGDFVSSLDPSAWASAMLSIQLSGLASCEEQEKVTAMKRDARLCVEFGDYCSRCVSVFGRCVACLERTKSFCCFNSHLARIINEQGRVQIGKAWGNDTARNPDCSGFSVAELQSLDFSRMDLSEFYAEITPTILDPGIAASNAVARVSACYFGNGQC